MSSSAANAVYPHLAKAEEPRREPTKSTLPEWAKSTNPLWSERPVITPSLEPYLADMGIRRRK
jgi:hypothetical protein